MLWRCNNYKCMFHICHKHQPIIRIDMHCAGQGDRSYPTFGDRNKSTRAFRFVWRKHANWQFLFENVLLLLIFVHWWRAKYNFHHDQLEWELCRLYWHLTTVLARDWSQHTLSMHSLRLSQLHFCIFVLLYFLPYSSFTCTPPSWHCYCSSIAFIYVCVGICLFV